MSQNDQTKRLRIVRQVRLEGWIREMHNELSKYPVRSDEFFCHAVRLEWTQREMEKNRTRDVFVLSEEEQMQYDWARRQKYVCERLAERWNDLQLADKAHECLLEVFARYNVDVSDQVGTKKTFLIYTLLPEMIKRLRESQGYEHLQDVEDLLEERPKVDRNGPREFSPEMRALLLTDPTAPGNERSRNEDIDPYGQFDVYPEDDSIDREFDAAIDCMEVDRSNQSFIENAAAQIRNDATAVREEDDGDQPVLTIDFDNIDEFSRAVNAEGSTEGDWVERQDQREQTQHDAEYRRRRDERLSRDLEALHDVQNNPEAIANLCRSWGWTEEEIQYCLRQREADMASDPHRTNPLYHDATPENILATAERQIDAVLRDRSHDTTDLRFDEAEEVAEQARRDLED